MSTLSMTIVLLVSMTVRKLEVSLPEKRVYVDYNAERVTLEQLRTRIDDIGFDATIEPGMPRLLRLFINLHIDIAIKNNIVYC